MTIKRVLLAKSRGFCAGVVRAIDTVERALDLFPTPIYIFHEIVHNRHVVEGFSKRNVVFVNHLEEVPNGAVCIFSAHGVSPQIEELARTKSLRVIDATCPLVTKVHREAVRFSQEGKSLVLIGHQGHEEIEGTMGAAPMQLVSSVQDVELLEMPQDASVVYLTQTTLSFDDVAQITESLERRFPNAQPPGKEDICYATQNRQNAVKEMAAKVDLVLVVGSQNSSNSQRLCEVSIAAGVPAYLINDETEIDLDWLTDAEIVGITAGASAPEAIVTRVLDRLWSLGAPEIQDLKTEEEDVHFALPLAFT